MLKRALCILIIFAAQLLLLLGVWPHHEPGQYTAALNAAVHVVERGSSDYARLARELQGMSVLLLDAAGNVLYSSGGIPPDPVAGVGAGYSALPVQLANAQGILVVRNPEVDAVKAAEDKFAILSVISVITSAALMLGCLLWLDRAIVRPFRNVKNVAEEIARGNLDVPLSMDRGGTFGAFTESFDLMRTKLAFSQAAEAKALEDKKELIAKLSHDIRTPIASIQAVSELGMLTSDCAAAERFSQICDKTLQMNQLVSNLLHAAIQEQTTLTVTLRCVSADEVKELLRGSDYQQWMDLIEPLPDCAVLADPVRLQQMFDNIFINAYKYGSAPVAVRGCVQDGAFLLELEDAGGGVPEDEAPRLHTKYFRGSNAKNAQGGGLGLYICSELLGAMNGELIVRNGDRGLDVSMILPLCRHKETLRDS